MKQAQVWSVDAIMAVTVVVIAVIGFFIFSTNTLSQRGNVVLTEDNTVLANTIGASAAGGNVTLLKEQLDEQKIVELSKEPYAQVRQELGLQSDFCIYFTDRNNHLLEIGGVRFLGSPDINVTVGGVTYPCNWTKK